MLECVIFSSCILYAFYDFRNRILASWSREAWSLLCRIIFLFWATTIVFRSSCDVEKNYLLGSIPLPPFPIVHGYGANDCIPRDILWWIVSQVSFYVAELIFLYRTPTTLKRKDDHVMMAHHWITIFISVLALFAEFFWPLMIVAAMYDVNDVFLDSAKAFRAQAKQTKSAAKKYYFSTLSSLLFYLFVFAWFFTRIYYVPLHAIFNFWTSKHLHNLATVHYVGFAAFLIVQIPQLFWTFLILKVAYRNIFCNTEIKDEDD